jgi:hypothetical protein
MEIRQSAQSVPTRPIVLVLAFLSVLAMVLTGWYVLTSGPRYHAGTATVTSTLSPDAADRNQQILQLRGELQSKAEATHGH